jgi:hypothetical protein
MMVENPLALQYIFTDDVYLLPQDKALVNKPSEADSNEPDMAQSVTAPPVTFHFTGGYQKNFLVLVYYPGHETMAPVHLSALESTIKRKELSMDDIAILNLHKYPDSEIKMVTAFFNPKKMLILGKSAVLSGLTPPPLNQIIKQNDYDILYSFSFDEMMGNKDNTKAFWDQMKVL